MVDWFEQPELQYNPSMEPAGWPLLRDLLMRKMFELQGNPYGYNAGAGQSMGSLLPTGGRPPFNPYGGGRTPVGGGGGGGMSSGLGRSPQSLSPRTIGNAMGGMRPPGGGGQPQGPQGPQMGMRRGFGPPQGRGGGMRPPAGGRPQMIGRDARGPVIPSAGHPTGHGIPRAGGGPGPGSTPTRNPTRPPGGSGGPFTPDGRVRDFFVGTHGGGTSAKEEGKKDPQMPGWWDNFNWADAVLGGVNPEAQRPSDATEAAAKPETPEQRQLREVAERARRNHETEIPGILPGTQLGNDSPYMFQSRGETPLGMDGGYRAVGGPGGQIYVFGGGEGGGGFWPMDLPFDPVAFASMASGNAQPIAEGLGAEGGGGGSGSGGMGGAVDPRRRRRRTGTVLGRDGFFGPPANEGKEGSTPSPVGTPRQGSGMWGAW